MCRTFGADLRTLITSSRHTPLLLHSSKPSLLLLVYRPPSLFGSSTFSSPPLKKIPLALDTLIQPLARLLAYRLILTVPSYPSRILIVHQRL